MWSRPGRVYRRHLPHDNAPKTEQLSRIAVSVSLDAQFHFSFGLVSLSVIFMRLLLNPAYPFYVPALAYTDWMKATARLPSSPVSSGEVPVRRAVKKS